MVQRFNNDYSEDQDIQQYESDILKSLQTLWNVVDEATDWAKKSLKWDLDAMTELKGYVPGLPLLKEGEVGSSEMLSPNECEKAVKMIIGFKSDNSSELKLPRITLENWSAATDMRILAILPGYIRTYGALMLRAMYDRTVEEGLALAQNRIDLSSDLSGKKVLWSRLRQPADSRDVKIEMVERRVLETVSGVQTTKVGWKAKIKSFLDNNVSAESRVSERLSNHFVWSKDVLHVLQLSLSEVRSSEDFMNRMQNTMKLTHVITTKQAEVEVAINEAKTPQERILLAFEYNVYEDCVKIMALYGEILRFDGILKGFVNRSSKFDNDQWTSYRQTMVNQIKAFSFDAHVLGVEKLIKELEIYLETWNGVLGEDEKAGAKYDRDMLLLDQKALEISKKFFDGEVSNEEQSRKLREELTGTEVDRTILEMEKRLVLDNESISDDDQRAVARDIEILKIHREIMFCDDDDGGREILERDGEILLLGRERDRVMELLAGGHLSEKEKYDLQYELDGISINMKILEIERDLREECVNESSFKRGALESNRRKLKNEQRMLAIDRQLNSPGLSLLSGTERNELQAERGVLSTENQLLDMDVLIYRNDDRLKDISYFSESIAGFCDKLDEKGASYVAQVRRGSELAESRAVLELEYGEKDDEFYDLRERHNVEILEYRELVEMLKSGELQFSALAKEVQADSPAYVKMERRLNLFCKQLESKKLSIANISEKISVVRKHRDEVGATLDIVKGNLRQIYRQALEVMGSGSMDASTYLSIMYYLRLIFKRLTELHENAYKLGSDVTEQLIDEISEANRLLNMDEYCKATKQNSGPRVFKPTMMSARDVTYYPRAGDDRPRVEVISPPPSHRQEIANAIFDVIRPDKNGKKRDETI